MFQCQVGDFKPFQGALVREGLVVSRPERRCEGHGLTCPASCAAPWPAGTPGTATRRPGSRRAPAAGRTGGRLCYTRHTGSACRPRLGERNVWYHSAAASLRPRSRSCRGAAGRDKARERCRALPASGEPPRPAPPPQRETFKKHSKTNKKNNAKSPALQRFHLRQREKPAK